MGQQGLHVAENAAPLCGHGAVEHVCAAALLDVCVAYLVAQAESTEEPAVAEAGGVGEALPNGCHGGRGLGFEITALHSPALVNACACKFRNVLLDRIVQAH